MLQKDLIQQPQIWQLVLEISSQAVEVVAFSPYENHSLIYESIPLDADAAGSHLRALENAIYDNPLLLSDFRHVTVLAATSRFLPVPEPAAAMAERMFRMAFPPLPDGPSEVLTTGIPSAGAAIAFEMQADVLGFLRRTFPSRSIVHPLAPQLAWLGAKYPTRSFGKSLVNLQPGRMDLIVLGHTAPLAVNSFSITCPMDALYYIMASRQANSISPECEVFVAGNRELRTEFSVMLREYVRFVMPAIFPSVMFRAGKASLSAPFEMILTPVTADLIGHET